MIDAFTPPAHTPHPRHTPPNPGTRARRLAQAREAPRRRCASARSQSACRLSILGHRWAPAAARGRREGLLAACRPRRPRRRVAQWGCGVELGGSSAEALIALRVAPRPETAGPVAAPHGPGAPPGAPLPSRPRTRRLRAIQTACWPLGCPPGGMTGGYSWVLPLPPDINTMSCTALLSAQMAER